MNTRPLRPVIRNEIKRIISETAQKHGGEAPSPKAVKQAKKQIPLVSAPWLRMLPSEQCIGTTVMGTEELAAAFIGWQLPEARIVETSPGVVRFTLPSKSLPNLIQARPLQSVWVALPRTPDVDFGEDDKVTNPLYAFSHAKGFQSILVHGGGNNTSIRPLSKALGLRTTRPPGNPRTLRVQPREKALWVEYLSETDFPSLRQASSESRALAACLCALTVGSGKDVFLDPFCADGLVITERGLLGPVKGLHGLEKTPERLAQAQQSWRILGPTAGYAPHDATFSLWASGQMPLDSHSVDAVASIIGPERWQEMEKAHFGEIARVLRPKAKAAFLVSDAQALQRILTESGLMVLETKEVGRPTLGYVVVATGA